MASSWVQRQVQQLRGKAQRSLFVYVCTSVSVWECVCACIYVNIFQKEWAMRNRNKQGQSGANPMVISAPTRHTRSGMTQARMAWFGPPGIQHTLHTHPSFQAKLNEFIQNDLKCTAHLFSTARDRLSSWNFLDALKGH